MSNDLDSVNAWLTAAHAVRPICLNPEVLDTLIAAQEERRDLIEQDLSDQWAISNNLDVVLSDGTRVWSED